MKKLLSVFALAACMMVASLQVNASSVPNPPYYSSSGEFNSYLSFYLANVLTSNTDRDELKAALGQSLGVGDGVGLTETLGTNVESALSIAVINYNYSASADISGFEASDIKAEFEQFLNYIGLGTLDDVFGLGDEQNMASTNQQDPLSALGGQAEIFKKPESSIPGVPIDGGLSFLALGGIAYGVRRFKKNS